MNMHASRLETKSGDPAPQEGPLEAKDIRDAVNAIKELRDEIDTKSQDFVTKDKIERIQDTLDALDKKAADFAQLKQAQEADRQGREELAEEIKKLGLAVDRMARPADETPEEKSAYFNDFIRGMVNKDLKGGLANIPEDQRKAVDRAEMEAKALNIGTGTEGGFFAPVEMARGIINDLLEISPFRSIVSVRQTSLRAVHFDRQLTRTTAVRVGEQETRTDTGEPTYGGIEVPMHELTAKYRITLLALEDSVYDLESEMSREVTEQFDLKEGKEFVSGDGLKGALGILADSDIEAIASGQATTIDADSLIKLKYALKTGYTRGARFIMNRTSIRAVRLLKGTDGHFIWQPAYAQSAPATIDGDPYTEMPDMPNIGAGTYPVAYGDFRRGYTWVDRIGMMMLKDPYTEADNGRALYRVRKRSSGRVTLPEAIKKMVIST